MTESYTGVRTHRVSKELVDEIFSNKKINTWDTDEGWYQNLYVVLQSGSSSALGRVKGKEIVLLEKPQKVFGLSPKNKEQIFTLDALMDDSIRVVVLTGVAGSGKTILSLASSLEKIQQKKYDKLILTKPMSQVTKYDLGALPGGVEEKFNPYLENYMGNLEFMIGGPRSKIKSMIEQYRIEFMPLQLIRGCSWHNAVVCADEIQILNYHEMVSLGTRIGEGSKLIIMGDMAQRDERIDKSQTGIHKFLNSELAKNSPMVASVELIESERSEVASLFANIFEAR